MYRQATTALASLSSLALATLATAQDSSVDRIGHDADDADAQAARLDSADKGSAKRDSARRITQDVGALRIEFDSDIQTLNFHGGRAATRPLVLVSIADADAQPLDDSASILDSDLSFMGPVFDDAGTATLSIADAAELSGMKIRVQAIALLDDASQQPRDWAISDILTVDPDDLARPDRRGELWPEWEPETALVHIGANDSAWGLQVRLPADAGEHHRMQLDAVAQDDFRGDWTIHLTLQEGGSSGAEAIPLEPNPNTMITELPGAKAGQKVEVWMRYEPRGVYTLVPIAHALLASLEVPHIDALALQDS